MSEALEGKGIRIPTFIRPPADAENRIVEVLRRARCDRLSACAALEVAHWDVDCAVEHFQAISRSEPKTFTWDDARDIAILVRDSLLMLVRGLERKFDLGKK